MNPLFEHQSQSFSWQADSFSGPADYSVYLDDADRAELMALVTRWQARVATHSEKSIAPATSTAGAGSAASQSSISAAQACGAIESMTASDLALGDGAATSALAAKLAQAARQVKSGLGFVVLRGLPTEAIDLQQYTAAVWAIGQHFGAPISQNASGDRLTYVIDATAVDPTPRMYRSNLELRPHTDITAMISLAGWNLGESGGATVLASGVRVHDVICERAPQMLARLYAGYHYHRLGEEGEGEQATTESRVPVFSNRNGQVSVRYLRTGIAAGHSARGLPLSADDLEALNYFDSVSTAPENRLAFFLERGEMIIVNNYAVMHARTRFVNNPQPGKERRLVRLWLDQAGFRDVPPEFNFYRTNGVPKAEGKRANFDFKKLYASDPLATGGMPDMKVSESDLARSR